MTGRQHAERRAAQAAAARKPENTARANKYPGRGNRSRWTPDAELLAAQCDECNAGVGEACRPYCIGEAAYLDSRR